jgi:hypothetical protein
LKSLGQVGSTSTILLPTKDRTENIQGSVRRYSLDAEGYGLGAAKLGNYGDDNRDR